MLNFSFGVVCTAVLRSDQFQIVHLIGYSTLELSVFNTLCHELLYYAYQTYLYCTLRFMFLFCVNLFTIISKEKLHGHLVQAYTSQLATTLQKIIKKKFKIF